MPTVIDELTVEVGLDGKKFTAGRRDLDEEMNKLKNSLGTLSKQIEGNGLKISEIFGITKRGLSGIVGAFIGGEAAAFIDRVVSMDAHTMRLAHSIGTSTRELSVWQNMVRGVGGSAADANSTFATLNDTFQSMQMGNMPDKGTAALFNRAGINPLEPGADPSQALPKIINFLQGMSPQQQRMWLSGAPGAGMNEGMIFLIMEMLRHPEKMKEFREQIEKLGPASEKAGEAAADLTLKTALLETAWESLARTLYPILTTIMGIVASIISSPKFATILGGAAAGAAAGTFVFPGLGTVAGAGVGAAAAILGDAAINGNPNNPPAAPAGAPAAPSTRNQGDLPISLFGLPPMKALTPLKPAASSSEILGFSSAIPIKPGAGSESAETAKALSVLASLVGIKEVTALNDEYHKNLGGKHPQGLAMDLTIKDPSKSADMAAEIKKRLIASGIAANVVDEYINPSKNATGGHIHVGLNPDGLHLLRGDAGATSNKTSSLIINGGINTNVRSNKADPAAVAQEVPETFQRMLGSIATGLA